MTSPEAGAIPTAPALIVRSALARGRALYNAGFFWASHEAFEGAWRVSEAPARGAYQALIHSAAALHKWLVQSNRRGAVRLSDWAVNGLEAHLDAEVDVDLGALLGPMATWRSWLAAELESVPPPLPMIQWRRRAPLMRVVSFAAYRGATPDEPVRIALSAEGGTGWGEVRGPASGSIMPDTDEMERIGQALVTAPFMSPSELPLRLGTLGLAGSSTAPAAEEAAWRLFALANGAPLASALGVAPRSLEVARVARRYGAQQDTLPASGPVRAGPVVIEIGPLQDRSLIPSIAAWPHPVIADAGGRYTRAYTDTLQAVAASGAALLAEPFADGDIVQTARLRRRLATPVSIPALTVEHTEAALYAHACEVVHLDPGVVGLFDSIRILDYVAERGVSAWVRSSARTPVGLSADLVVASHPASTWPIQLSARGEEILRETGPDGTLDRSVVDMILEPPEESRALASQLLLRVGS